MQFNTNNLPEDFQVEHGSIDLTDDKPLVEGDNDGEDEDLDLSKAGQRVWLCKVPRFLMEEWSKAQQEGEILGRVRVYDEKDSRGNPKIAVILNPSTSASSSGPSSPDVKGKRPLSASARGPANDSNVPAEYKLTMQNTESKNLFVFGEKIEEVEETGEEGARKKRRITSLLGTVAHECSLTPNIGGADASAAYARILRERQRKATEPKRTLKRLDVDEATANRLASGMGMAGVKGRVATFNNTSSRGGKASGPGAPRYARLPKNELLDLLFTHFSSAPYWSLRSLNDHVKQPQVYLKEVLAEIATLVPKGPYAQMYALKPEFKGTQGVGSAQSGGAGPRGAVSGSSAGDGRARRAGVKQETESILGEVPAVKKEEDDYDDDDGDSDGGMEIVS
ncbi:hypothetical protein JCM8547_000260 [Rhodosporidiobolus lusitaniae]